MLNSTMRFEAGGGRWNLWRWGGLALALAIFTTAIVASRGPSGVNFPEDAPGVAVVELFTSQGCSSCPPADDYLAELAQSARVGGLAIYPLAFHVDYWDSPRMKDAFSSPEFTKRQRDYAHAFNATRIYTPQMIVNGTAEFIGSDRQAGSQAIREALQAPPAATISLSAARDRDQWRVEYAVDGALDDSDLNVALVRRGISQKIERGENAGRTLKHENVVVAFESVALSGGGARGQISLGGGAAAQDHAIIAYAQSRSTRRVLGAARLDLARPTNHSTSNDSTSNDQTINAKGSPTMTDKAHDDAPAKIEKSDEEWRQELTPEQYRVLRKHGTERAFTGAYWNTKDKGVYVCAACGQELFESGTKFDSGTGWPSYWEPVKPDAVGTQEDRSLFSVRTEVHCSRCGGHLGHVFEDGPKPTGLRYCINSVSLDFKPSPE